MSRSQLAMQEAGTSMNAWRALLGRQVALVRDRYGYKVNGRYFRRVTTLLDGIPKPALTSWAARTVAEFAVEHKDSWLSLPRTDAVKLLKGWRTCKYGYGLICGLMCSWHTPTTSPSLTALSHKP